MARGGGAGRGDAGIAPPRKVKGFGKGRGGGGLSGARKIAIFHFFLRNPSAAEDFPRISWKSARNLAGLDPRGTFPPRLRDFPGGKSPEFRAAPRISLDFFHFSRSRALSRPVAPRCPPFPQKVREKTKDFDRIRLLKVPKGKVPRSVSQAAAVLRRSVPAGAIGAVRSAKRS